jgi:hypothetical protein
MKENTMKKQWIALMTVALCFGLAATVLAADNDGATVTYEVTAINELDISGNPGNMTVSTATAGSQPEAVTDATTTYAITTNGTNKKITAELDTAMPTGTTLKVNLAAPSVGISAGQVTLSTSAADVVTGITEVVDSAKTISYELGATVDAGVVGSATKTVTFTIADGAA